MAVGLVKKFFESIKKHNLIYLEFPYDKNISFFTKKFFIHRKKLKQNTLVLLRVMS